MAYRSVNNEQPHARRWMWQRGATATDFRFANQEYAQKRLNLRANILMSHKIHDQGSGAQNRPKSAVFGLNSWG